MVADHRAGSGGWADGWMDRPMGGGKIWFKELISKVQKWSGTDSVILKVS
jgi:hypothetical protein